MFSRLSAFALLSILVMAALPGLVSAVQPAPVYSASCTVGGDTTATWKHVQVDIVEFDWYSSDGFDGDVTDFPNANAHAGRDSASTPAMALSPVLYVQWHEAGGGWYSPAPFPCS